MCRNRAHCQMNMPTHAAIMHGPTTRGTTHCHLGMRSRHSIVSGCSSGIIGHLARSCTLARTRERTVGDADGGQMA